MPRIKKVTKVAAKRGRPKGAASQQDQESSISRFVLVGPTKAMYRRVITMLQEVFEATGQQVQITIEEVKADQIVPMPSNLSIDRPSAARRRLPQPAPAGNGHAVAPGYPPVVAPPVVPQIRGRKVAAPPVAPRGGRNSVVYQVLNGTPPTGSTKAQVHAFLMANQAKGHLCSAREVMDRTHLGQKAVESAIHGLRTEGWVKSVEVPQAPAGSVVSFE